MLSTTHPLAKKPAYQALRWLYFAKGLLENRWSAFREHSKEMQEAQDLKEFEASNQAGRLITGQRSLPPLEQSQSILPIKQKSKKESGENQDTLHRLGFGICAYRNLLWYMFIIFLISSFLVTP